MNLLKSQGFTLTKFQVDHSSRYREISSQMDLGTQVRETRASLLSEFAIAKVQEKRNARKDGNKKGSSDVAYIFDSIKHPDESKLLRDIYGDAYYQIGVFSSESQRISFLINKDGIKKKKMHIS